VRSDFAIRDEEQPVARIAFFETCWPKVNFCCGTLRATRASSPSSRSWKMAALFQQLDVHEVKVRRVVDRGK